VANGLSWSCRCCRIPNSLKPWIGYGQLVSPGCVVATQYSRLMRLCYPARSLGVATLAGGLLGAKDVRNARGLGGLWRSCEVECVQLGYRLRRFVCVLRE
jgi:hypothetical protein